MERIDPTNSHRWLEFGGALHSLAGAKFTSMSASHTFLIGASLLAVCGCTVWSARSPSPSPSPSLPQPVAAAFQREVKHEIEQNLATPQAATLSALSEAATLPADYKQPFVVQGLTDPWTGLAAFEREGHRLVELVRSGPQALPELIGTMEAATGRTAEPAALIPIPTEPDAEAMVAYLLAVLQQAQELREKAVRKLSQADRRFLFDHAASIVEHFSPQISDGNEQTMARIEADRRFCRLVSEQLDYPALITAAQVLARLGNERWLHLAAESFLQVETRASPPSGITGEVLLVRETPFGLLVIGGPGPNTYELDQRVALVLDLGGDDHYRGVIAAPAVVEQGISVVIDLAGNDIYRASPLGLATGRLGVGLLIDRAGDDRYELAQGTGGAGFAGLGILDDVAGDDHYIGTRFTQGAAVGGLGLMVDRSGHDTFTSFGYAIGFGGPLGVGAVLDAAGDDRYQCGEKYPSESNAAEQPDVKPGDPLFQYDCFGMGTGSGTRVYPGTQGLAGGWGILIDLEGDDHYRSSNFSQGAGYFFGAGLKLDMTGNDEHAAARYGHAAAAHMGLGLFIDYSGHDHYTSTGPVYNGGVAWDRSVALCIDAGEGDDRYDLRRSDGLGRADHNSWSMFIEEGGKDRYVVPNGMGRAVNTSLSGFFDLAGEDEYTAVPGASLGERRNGQTLVDPAGGLFQDR